MLKRPKRIIVCEQSEERRAFVQQHYPDVLLTKPEECADFVAQNSDHGGADRVLEVAGGNDTFRLAWLCARPNAIVTIVALYAESQSTAATAKRFCVSSRKAKSTPRRSSPIAFLSAKSTKPTACLKTKKTVSSKWLSIIETSKHEIHTPDIRFAPMPGVSLYRKGYTS